jgi:glutaminyl-tRNA synthetase
VLITAGKAYICELKPEQLREYRGTLTERGKNSPYRDRAATENLALLEKMRLGDIEEGRMVLRAKIDMSSPNLNMRDPVLYRIKRSVHHRTGDTWNIYPSYDFAHGQEDAIEGITHSVCTLEFADHRPLYEWFIDNLPVPSKPHQYEFGRLNLSYTVVSKRKLKQLVESNYVDGWDDPRMPTLSGLRRRGVNPAAIREFSKSLAVAKTDGTVDMSQLEHFIRQDLNENAPRAMCVLDPVKLTLTNWPDEKEIVLTVPVHPNREDLGERQLQFGQALYIDRADFSEDTGLSRKKFKRLVLGDYIRLRGAYVVRADGAVHNEAGQVTEILATVIQGTLGHNPAEGIKPRGVIHWVAAHDCVDCEVHLYDRLFKDSEPDLNNENISEMINADSLDILTGCKAEASLAEAKTGTTYQFERQGYFCLDIGAGYRGTGDRSTGDTGSAKQGAQDNLVFNRTIGLRDNWSHK